MTSLVLGWPIHSSRAQQRFKEKQLHTSQSRVGRPTRHPEVSNHTPIRPYQTRETGIVAKGWRRFHPRLLITQSMYLLGKYNLEMAARIFFLAEKFYCCHTRTCFASASPKRNRGAELRSQLQFSKEAMDKELMDKTFEPFRLISAGV